MFSPITIIAAIACVVVQHLLSRKSRKLGFILPLLWVCAGIGVVVWNAYSAGHADWQLVVAFIFGYLILESIRMSAAADKKKSVRKQLDKMKAQ